MKITLFLIVAIAIGCASAMPFGHKAPPKCRANNVGVKYPFPNNPRKYWECTESGRVNLKCPKGTFFNNDEQACVTDEEACEPVEEPVPEDSEAVESDESVPVESQESEESVESEEEVTEPAPESESVESEEEITEEPVPESEESEESEEPVEEETEEPISEESEEEETPTEEPVESPESESEESAETDPPAPESSEEEPIEESEEPVESESEESAETEAPPESGETEEVPSEETEEIPSEETVEVPSEETEEDSGSVEQPGCKTECSYHGEYLQNPEDCHSFFQCSWGTPYYHPCPDGLVFNPNLNVCDWPFNYPCEGKPECGKPPVDPECPAVVCEYEGQYLKNPEDCHSFYQCANAAGGGLRAVLQPCGMESDTTRLVWSQEKLTCDWSRDTPCNVSC